MCGHPMTAAHPHGGPTACPLVLDHAPPSGAYARFAARCEPGRVVFERTYNDDPSWAWGNVGGVPGARDSILAVDGRPLWRSQGAQYGLISSAVATAANGERVHTLVFDRGYYGWGPGTHSLTWGYILERENHVVHQSEYRLTLPPDGQALASPRRPLVADRLPRNLFWLSPAECREHGLSPSYLRQSGVDTMTVGGFFWPGHGATLPAWKADWDAQVRRDLDWCRAGGFLALVEVDGLYRSATERLWYDTCPWRDDALRHVRDTFASHRDVVAGVSGLDEIVWGPKGPIDTKALHALWRENPEAPLWCWPSGHAEPYETPDQADWAVRYTPGGGSEFSSKLAPGGLTWSLAQLARNYDTLLPRLANVPQGWPLGVQVQVQSGTYRKRLVASCYPEPAYGDTVLDAGRGPEQMAAAVWLGVWAGASFLRGYMYDALHQKRIRHNYGPMAPTGWTQYGVAAGSPRWEAMAHALRAVEARQRDLVTLPPLVPTYRDNWAAGGADGLPFAINCASIARPCPYPDRGTLLTEAGERPYDGDKVPPGGVVLGG